MNNLKNLMALSIQTSDHHCSSVLLASSSHPLFLLNMALLKNTFMAIKIALERRGEFIWTVAAGSMQTYFY
jgi:hypothetical protein